MIAELESYLSELKTEVQAVEEHRLICASKLIRQGKFKQGWQLLANHAVATPVIFVIRTRFLPETQCGKREGVRNLDDISFKTSIRTTSL